MSFPPTITVAFGGPTLQSLQSLRVSVPVSSRSETNSLGDPPNSSSSLAHQSASELALADHRLEELRVALHGCVSDTPVLVQTVEDFAHGTGAQLPALFGDPGLGLRKGGFFSCLLRCP